MKLSTFITITAAGFAVALPIDPINPGVSEKSLTVEPAEVARRQTEALTGLLPGSGASKRQVPGLDGLLGSEKDDAEADPEAPAEGEETPAEDDAAAPADTVSSSSILKRQVPGLDGLLGGEKDDAEADPEAPAEGEEAPAKDDAAAPADTASSSSILKRQEEEEASPFGEEDDDLPKEPKEPEVVSGEDEDEKPPVEGEEAPVEGEEPPTEGEEPPTEEEPPTDDATGALGGILKKRQELAGTESLQGLKEGSIPGLPTKRQSLPVVGDVLGGEEDKDDDIPKEPKEPKVVSEGDEGKPSGPPAGAEAPSDSSAAPPADDAAAPAPEGDESAAPAPEGDESAAPTDAAGGLGGVLRRQLGLESSSLLGGDKKADKKEPESGSSEQTWAPNDGTSA